MSDSSIPSPERKGSSPTGPFGRYEVRFLLYALYDPVQEVRTAALRVLVRLRLTEEAWDLAGRFIRRALEPPVPADARSEVQIEPVIPQGELIEAAVYVPDARIRRRLQQLVAEGTEEVRRMAAHALARARDPHAIPQLVAELSDAEPMAQIEAAAALSLLDVTTAYEQVRQVCRTHRDGVVCFWLALALARLGDTESIERYLRDLQAGRIEEPGDLLRDGQPLFELAAKSGPFPAPVQRLLERAAAREDLNPLVRQIAADMFLVSRHGLADTPIPADDAAPASKPIVGEAEAQELRRQAIAVAARYPEESPFAADGRIPWDEWELMAYLPPAMATVLVSTLFAQLVRFLDQAGGADRALGYGNAIMNLPAALWQSFTPDIPSLLQSYLILAERGSMAKEQRWQLAWVLSRAGLPRLLTELEPRLARGSESERLAILGLIEEAIRYLRYEHGPIFGGGGAPEDILPIPEPYLDTEEAAERMDIRPQPALHPAPSPWPSPPPVPLPSTDPSQSVIIRPSLRPWPAPSPESPPQPSPAPSPASPPRPKSAPSPASPPQPKSAPSPASPPQPRPAPSPASPPRPRSAPSPASPPQPRPAPSPAPPPRPTPRWLQAQVFETWEEPVTGERKERRLELALRARAEHRLTVWIGPDTGEQIRAPDAFPEELLPPDQETYELQIVFWEEEHASTPQIGTIFLPREGRNSTPCDFHFRALADVPVFEGRLVIMHANRILQTMLLVARVLPDPAEAPPDARISLQRDTPVRANQAALGAHSAFDTAIFTDTGRDGQPQMAAVSGHRTALRSLEGVAQTIKLIRGRIEQIADSPEDFGTLQSKATEKLLRFLARQGSMLYQGIVETYLPDHPLRTAGRVQLVSARESDLPLEFMYDRPSPAPDAVLCPNAASALVEGKCDGCDGEGEAIIKQRICPLGFWCTNRIIERHWVEPVERSDLEGAEYAVGESDPTADRAGLNVLSAAVYAASDKVNAAQAEDLRQSLTAVTGQQVERVQDWRAWCKAIKERCPSILLLLPHTLLDDDAIPTLEIGTQQQLARDAITADYVRGGPGQPPVVLLLGCQTAVPDIPYQAFATQFRTQGAAIVLSTLAPVLGRHVVPVAQMLVEELRRAAEVGGTFGDALLVVRRHALAAGLPMVLSLVAAGDADWRLQGGKDV